MIRQVNARKVGDVGQLQKKLVDTWRIVHVAGSCERAMKAHSFGFSAEVQCMRDAICQYAQQAESAFDV